LSGDVADVPYMGIYNSEATQRYICGTRFITWDGRVYKYGKAGAATTNMKHAQVNYNQLVAEVSDPDAEIDAAVAGASRLTLTVTAATIGVSRNGIIAEDELAGGFISMYNAVTTGDRPQRMIVGNDALASTGVQLVLYLEYPLAVTFTTGSNNSEIMANPYTDLRSGAYGGALGQTCPAMGMANIMTVSGEYFWLQTWGPCRVTPNAAAYGGSDAQWQLCFDGYGSVCTHEADHDLGTSSYAHAGFIMNRQAGTAEDQAPFVMLQVSI
jgi:hypothetical protein